MTNRPGEGETIANWDGEPILRYQTSSPFEAIVGDVEALPLWAGQSVGVIRDVLPGLGEVEAGERVATLAVRKPTLEPQSKVRPSYFTA